MNNEQKFKITTLIIAVFLLAALGMVTYFIQDKEVANRDLISEKLRSEKLLSEKLRLDKQIKNFKEVIHVLEGKDAELDKFLSQANVKIKEQESSIYKLNEINSSLVSYKKESEDFKKTKDELVNQIAGLMNNSKSLSEQIHLKEKMLKQSKKENQLLRAQNIQFEKDQLISNNFRVESIKNKHGKLTVKANKTSHVVVSFDIPASEIYNITSFHLELNKTPGLVIKGDQKVVLSKEENNFLFASANKYSTAILQQRATISFKPTEKLKQGIYSITVFRNTERLGDIQIRLTK